MKRPCGLAPFAGHDPFEREIGNPGAPQTKASLAITASHAALLRYARLRAAARFAPPTAAVGRFPYQHRTLAEVREDKRRNHHVNYNPCRAYGYDA